MIDQGRVVPTRLRLDFAIMKPRMQLGVKVLARWKNQNTLIAVWIAVWRGAVFVQVGVAPGACASCTHPIKLSPIPFSLNPRRTSFAAHLDISFLGVKYLCALRSL